MHCLVSNKHKINNKIMKKYFAIAMIALASVCASSCNKDNSKTEESAKNYINTWVTEPMAATDVLSDMLQEFSTLLPAGSISEISAEVGDAQLRRCAQFFENGETVYGIVVDKASLLKVVNGISSWAEKTTTLEDYQKSALKLIAVSFKTAINQMSDNDILGTKSNYSIVEKDATSGVITISVTETEDGKEVTTKRDVNYSNLSATTLTVSYTEKLTLDLKSAASCGITPGKFVDFAELQKYLPADSVTPAE